MKNSIVTILLLIMGLGSFTQPFSIDSSFVSHFDFRSQNSPIVTNIYETNSGQIVINGTFRFFNGPVQHAGVVSFNQNGTAESFTNLAQFSIFPNPSNGNATIVYKLNGDQNAVLQVFDVNGRLVKKQPLITDLERQSMDLSYLNNGIYHFSVILKGERLFNGKLVLTK